HALSDKTTEKLWHCKCIYSQFPGSFQESELLTIKHMPCWNEIVQTSAIGSLLVNFVIPISIRAFTVSYLKPVREIPSTAPPKGKKDTKGKPSILFTRCVPAFKTDNSLFAFLTMNDTSS